MPGVSIGTRKAVTPRGRTPDGLEGREGREGREGLEGLEGVVVAAKTIAIRATSVLATHTFRPRIR
jgi:hypothetical protein